MDLLDFEAQDLYFDEPINEKAKLFIEQSAECYGTEESELLLLKAFFLEPEHLVVLVALYRYYYYQHRLDDSLIVAERVIRLIAGRLKMPLDWNEINETELGYGVMVSMTMVRLYLQSLKGAAYLELRLGDYEAATARLLKLVELDSNDRLGGTILLELAQNQLNKQAVA